MDGSATVKRFCRSPSSIAIAPIAKNNFDKLKNQWGWGGFTTHDLSAATRWRAWSRWCNWWNLFVRLADPDHHREAITSRPLLLRQSDGRPAMPAAPP
jgi:hypothetical protein